MHTLDRAQANTHSLPVNDSHTSVTDAYTHTGCVGGRPARPTDAAPSSYRPQTLPGPRIGDLPRSKPSNGQGATEGHGGAAPCYCGRPPGRRHDPECPAKPYQGATIVPGLPETLSEVRALSRNTGRLSGRRRTR